MGELVRFLGQVLKSLWAGLGSCSLCMSNCDVAIFLIYISGICRLVDVSGRRKHAVMTSRFISTGPTNESRVVEVNHFPAAMAYQCRHDLVQLRGPLLLPCCLKAPGRP